MQDGNYPSIIINSINLKKLLDLVASNQLDELAEYVVEELQRLAGAGADFGVLASSTAHIVFDDINRLSPIPLISIVRLTCSAVRESGLKKLGLFGTRFTMKAGFYGRVFSDEGMIIVTPDEDGQTFIHDKYMNELVNGIFLDETRERLLAIAE